MDTLNLGSEEVPEGKKKSKNRNLKIALGLAAVILVPTIGSTLAGNITVGTGSVEFGQGSVTTAACDSAITVTPTSTFTNTSGAGTFKVGTVLITGIADACSGKTFKITAYGDTGAALTLSTGGADSPECVATYTLTASTNSIASEASNNCVGTVSTYSAGANSITFTPASVLASTSVYKFTLETS